VYRGSGEYISDQIQSLFLSHELLWTENTKRREKGRQLELAFGVKSARGVNGMCARGN
jgi:hypothetical protein